jgi:hypothetical protein
MYTKTDMAKWILPEIAVFLLFKIGSRKDLKSSRAIFSRGDFLKVRLVENLVCVLPFMFFLMYKGEWLIAPLLIPIAGVMTFVNFQMNLIPAIPTPFKKFPWEFIAGFRKTFWLLPILYFVIFKAIQVDNFNLGLVALMIHFFVMMSFYMEPEKSFFVWVFKETPQSFLFKKWKTSMLCALIFTLPAFVVMSLFFSDYFVFILAAYLLGFIMLSSVILAKYSAYPYQMNVPQGILYAVSLFFPPVLPLCIWLFYRQSIRSLKPYLE